MATSPADPSGTAPALAGPFTLREVVVMGGAVLLLIGSVLPFQIGGGSYANVWTFHTTAFNQFVTLALPLVLGGAFAWRRLAGRTKVTAGSLTLDQLASVVSLLGILYFFISSVMSMNPAFLLGLLGSLLMAGGTTVAPYIPGFVLDFAPGQGALLTRPIRPSAPRATGSAASPATPGHAQSPAAASGTGHDAGSPTVATGLAATHSTAPEPAPGAWPRPQATGEPADVPAADPTAQPSGTPAAGPADAPSVDPALADPQEAPEEQGAATTPEHQAPATVVGDQVPAGSTAPAADTAAGEDPAGAAATASPSGEPGPSADHDPAGTPEQDSEPSPSAAPGDQPEPAAEPEPEEHSFSATSSGSEHPTPQAFWFAVPDRRTAVNEATGRNAFVLEPGEWILALEDRGYEFLVQDSEGSVGVLRDLGRIERA